MSISITWHRCKHLVIDTSINIVISRNIHTTMFISKPTSIQNVISIPISISMSKRILPIHWIVTAQVSAFRIAHGIGSNIDTKIIQQRSKIAKTFFLRMAGFIRHMCLPLCDCGSFKIAKDNFVASFGRDLGSRRKGNHLAHARGTGSQVLGNRWAWLPERIPYYKKWEPLQASLVGEKYLPKQVWEIIDSHPQQLYL